MSSNQQFLQNLYEAFNKGELETIISVMHPDVKWANGVSGGFVYGRDAVREYWINQYKVIQVQLETLKFETDENNRNVVTVHQIVRDLQGEFENDPNVTDKKFPGNPTRSYRSQAPLKIVGEVTDWVRQTPEELQKWREKLANNKGEIIN